MKTSKTSSLSMLYINDQRFNDDVVMQIIDDSPTVKCPEKVLSELRKAWGIEVNQNSSYEIKDVNGELWITEWNQVFEVFNCYHWNERHFIVIKGEAVN